MATIRMVLTSLRNPSMPQGLDVTNWIESINIDPNGGDTGTFSNTRNGATAELDFAGQNWTRTGSSYSGTVTSLSYGSAYIHGSLPQFTITGLNLSLAALLANKSSIMAMALAGNDIAYGSAGNDTIYTGVGNDRAYGGNGHDYIDGGAGNDDIFGGTGVNDLYGGTGADYFSMSARGTGASDDFIADFEFDRDRVDVSAWGVS
ncbi:hypothetical protein DLM20_25055, partial [Salmonella enterica subsp. enterica serovar Java]|nr:hypothetical protein [Salmonella enterica subsp. enterica serovar Java]